MTTPMRPILPAIHPAILLLAALLCAQPLHAQDVDDFESDPAPTRSAGGIFGAGGAVTPIWFMPNMDVTNAELARLGFPALPDGGMFMLGGRGYAYIIIVPNLRVGGMGAGTSVTAERTSGSLREASSMSTAFGGVTLEYVVPFGRFHLAAGGLLGGGSRTLTLQRAPVGDKSWPGAPGAPVGEEYRVYANSYLAWQPWLTAEYEISPFVVAGLTGGWYGTSGSTWTLNDHFPVSGMPDFKSDGPFVRLDLTIGLFIGE